MRYAVMTWGLFEVRNIYEQNEILLSNKVNQLKDVQKTHTKKIAELKKQLLKAKQQKDTSESNCRDLQATVATLNKDLGAS